jgi:antitoxin (DNA-binding transcriptional repressor) of toxin-antitoxin stability system
VIYPSPKYGYNLRVNALKDKNQLSQAITYAQAGDEYVIAKQRLALHRWCARCTAPGLRTAPRLHGAASTR